MKPRRGRGFTLLEVLTVIAIIGILATITLKVGQGVQRRSAVSRAKADMAIIASALEQYKLQYGDYPWTPATLPSGLSYDSQVLFNALCGNLGPKATGPLSAKGRTFVDISKMKTWWPDQNLPDPSATTLVTNSFVDPWGHVYYYYYKTDLAKWKSPSFLLYSHGPDGLCNLVDSGTGVSAEDTGYVTDIPASDSQNTDNIYLGRD